MNQRQNQTKNILIEQFIIFRNAIELIGKQHTATLSMLFGNILLCFTVLYPNERKINPIQSNIVRGAGILALNVILSWQIGLSLSFFAPRSLIIVIIRSILLVIFNYVFLRLHFYLPLPLIQSINCTGPLVVFILDYLINGTGITKNQLIGSVAGVIGVLIAINSNILSQFMMSDSSFTSNFENYEQLSIIGFIFACLMLIFIIFLWAQATIIVKSVGLNVFEINVAMGVCFTFTFGLMYQILVDQPSSGQIFYYNFLLNGLPYSISVFLINSGLLLSKQTGRLAMTGFSSVFISYLISVFRYGEKVNKLSIFGDFFLLFGLYIVEFKNKQ